MAHSAACSAAVGGRLTCRLVGQAGLLSRACQAAATAFMGRPKGSDCKCAGAKAGTERRYLREQCWAREGAFKGCHRAVTQRTAVEYSRWGRGGLARRRGGELSGRQCRVKAVQRGGAVERRVSFDVSWGGHKKRAWALESMKGRHTVSLYCWARSACRHAHKSTWRAGLSSSRCRRGARPRPLPAPWPGRRPLPW